MRKPRKKNETAQERAERLDDELERQSARKADDANVQRMIERSIKDHGA